MIYVLIASVCVNVLGRGGKEMFNWDNCLIRRNQEKNQKSTQECSELNEKIIKYSF